VGTEFKVVQETAAAFLFAVNAGHLYAGSHAGKARCADCRRNDFDALVLTKLEQMLVSTQNDFECLASTAVKSPGTVFPSSRDFVIFKFRKPGSRRQIPAGEIPFKDIASFILPSSS
jgi:hypothetical protein